jgi:hypothetical protein
MTKTKYEQDRDENVRKVQERFKTLGIPLLSQEVRDILSKKKKRKEKRLISDKPSSDNDYDPSSDIDNQSDSDDDYDDDLNNEVNAEVRCITWPINRFLVPPVTNMYFTLVN